MSKQKSVFLEVDSDIVEKNLLLNNDSQVAGEIDNLLRFTQNYSKEGTTQKVITPTPGLVIKTYDTKGNKIFINLCQTDDIPEPRELSVEELLSLWEPDAVTNFRLQISIQDPHDEYDASGKLASVYDVAINTNFFKKMKENELLRLTMIQMIQEGLEEKYNIELKKRGYVILRNVTCVGKLKPHNVRSSEAQDKRKKHLIQEIDALSSKQSTSDSSKKKTDINNPLKNMHYRLLCKDTMMVGQFHLPGIKACQDIKLDIGENRITLQANGLNDSTDVFLPHKINENKTVARFNVIRKMLTILMPRLNCG